jgi:hypothetical protein
MGVVITTGSGLAATLERMVTSKYKNRPFHTRWEVAKDTAISALIGVAGYMVSYVQNADAAWVSLGLIVAGYGGSRVLTTAVDRLLDTISSFRQHDSAL